MTRIGVRYPGGIYMPGGRTWQFRHPRAQEVALTIAHLGRQRGNPVSRWLYLHWPTEPRKDGTTW